jgi:hypothetical protein
MKVRQKYSDKTWKTQKKFQKIYFHFRGFRIHRFDQIQFGSFQFYSTVLAST